MSDKDIWDQAADSAQGSGTDDLPGADSADSFENRESVLEAESVTAVKRKKNPAILVAIILIGVGMFGGVGYIGFELYSKFFPTSVAKKSSFSSSSAIGTETPASLESTGGVPVGKGGDGLAGMPGAEAVSASPPATAASAPFPGASSAQPAGSAALTGSATPVSVTPSVAPTASTAAVSGVAAASLETAKLAQCTADCAAKTEALEADNRRLQAEVDALKAPKPAKVAAPKKPYVHKAKAKKVEEAPKAEKAVEKVITESATIADYKIMSIHPKTGAFQKAWVQDAKGRLTIVGAGDRLAGARVLKVDYDTYEVETTKGRVK